jgi:hypothetical protein
MTNTRYEYLGEPSPSGSILQAPDKMIADEMNTYLGSTIYFGIIIYEHADVCTY